MVQAQYEHRTAADTHLWGEVSLTSMDCPLCWRWGSSGVGETLGEVWGESDILLPSSWLLDGREAAWGDREVEI